jgi:hypothetical protein
MRYSHAVTGMPRQRNEQLPPRSGLVRHQAAHEIVLACERLPQSGWLAGHMDVPVCEHSSKYIWLLPKKVTVPPRK